MHDNKGVDQIGRWMSQKVSPVPARTPLTEEDIAGLRAAIDARLDQYFAHHEPDSRLVCAIRHG